MVRSFQRVDAFTSQNFTASSRAVVGETTRAGASAHAETAAATMRTRRLLVRLANVVMGPSCSAVGVGRLRPVACLTTADNETARGNPTLPRPTTAPYVGLAVRGSGEAPPGFNERSRKNPTSRRHSHDARRDTVAMRPQ